MAELIVDIASIRPGMRLAKDIRSSEGQVMYPAGSAVTEGMLQALRAGGLLRVSIESEAPPSAPPPAGPFLKRCLKKPVPPWLTILPSSP